LTPVKSGSKNPTTLHNVIETLISNHGRLKPYEVGKKEAAAGET